MANFNPPIQASKLISYHTTFYLNKKFLLFRGYLWAGVLISLVSGGIVFLILAKFHRVIEAQVSTTNVIYVQSLHPIHRFRLTHQNNFMAQENENENEQLIGLYQFEHATNSFLYTYSMLLLVSLPKLPAGWSLRVFTGWWWLYCILLVVAYRAAMTAILANPVPR